MARKAKIKENESIPEEQELSPLDVWDIIEFARSLSGSGLQYLSPELISGRMKDITLNPIAATTETLNHAMKAPKDNEEALQAFSQDFELQSMVYKRLISYLSGILAFDLTYTSDVKKSEDYKSPKYKKDLAKVEEFLRKFDYQTEFGIVVRQLLRNDVYFGCVRDLNNSVILQELPSKYCKITGRWAHGFLFSFDMSWFLQAGVDINMYPEFFIKKYKEIYVKTKRNIGAEYLPELDPRLRGKHMYSYWVDVPVDVGVCFKLAQELATRLPYFTPLFNDLVLQGVMRNLQKNANMASASKMIIGEVPMLHKDAKASVKDSIAISPELLGKFLALVKSAVSESIQVASAPLENMKAISFEESPNIYEKYLKTALASSGVNTNLIFSSDTKPNVIETQLSLGVDEQLMMSLYGQFNGFLNYWVGKETKTFKFKFEFEGTEFFTNRKTRFDNAMELFRQGIVLPQKISAAIGMKPFEMERQMEEAIANDFMSKLSPPSIELQKRSLELQPQEPHDGYVRKTVDQVDKDTGEPVKQGRPRVDITEISDGGADSRNEGTNIARGGTI